MTWQDIAVWIVVAGAALFLVGRNVSLRRRRKQPAQTFIPLSTLRKPPAGESSSDRPCH
jgi:hypothetical protein